jgi:hypothetical protein
MCPWELTFKILEENKKIYWQNHHIGLLQHSIFFWLVKEHSLRYDMSRGRPGPRAVALVMAQETPSIPCLFLAHILHKSAQQTAPSSHPGRLGHSNRAIGYCLPVPCTGAPSLAFHQSYAGEPNQQIDFSVGQLELGDHQGAVALACEPGRPADHCTVWHGVTEPGSTPRAPAQAAQPHRPPRESRAAGAAILASISLLNFNPSFQLYVELYRCRRIYSIGLKTEIRI